MKACVIFMLVICAAVIVEQSDAKQKYLIIDKCRLFNLPPGCQIPHGPPVPANKYRRGCSAIFRNLSSNSPSKLPFFHGNSISAPVTPPLARSPTYDQVIIPDSGWLSGMQTPQSGPSSPTFSLVSRNPFFDKEAFKMGDCNSPMWTPGQSRNCFPAFPAGVDQNSDVPMADGMAAEFAFGMVKPWEGERIHGEFVSDDLELTLGNSRTR
ncbi:unnamed protein product [Brassica oleracea]|uniref:Protein BZR1 homolog n=2 Tax=Brassica oleracea TaxID=3712 RepID=A0A0D3DEY6_BRAOL|nr:unnamed protein product [Brassica oleracea]